MAGVGAGGGWAASWAGAGAGGALASSSLARFIWGRCGAEIHLFSFIVLKVDSEALCQCRTRHRGCLRTHARAHVTMAAVQAEAVGELDEHTERVLQIATCMAMAGFGEAVACMVGMARTFYGDEVLWAVHKG